MDFIKATCIPFLCVCAPNHPMHMGVVFQENHFASSPSLPPRASVPSCVLSLLSTVSSPLSSIQQVQHGVKRGAWHVRCITWRCRIHEEKDQDEKNASLSRLRSIRTSVRSSFPFKRGSKRNSRGMERGNLHVQVREATDMDEKTDERVAQVRLAGPVARYDVATASGTGGCLSYDDANRKLLAVQDGKVLAWCMEEHQKNDNAVAVSEQMSVEKQKSGRKGRRRTPDVTYVHPGRAINARFSLDGTLLAWERTDPEIEFVVQDDPSLLVWHKLKTQASIVGFFWTKCNTSNFVVITTNGVELYQVRAKERLVELRQVKKHKVAWCIYSHESRLLLLAKTKGSGRMYGYQFTAHECVKLPKFYVDESTLEPRKEDFAILVLYGRIYCCHFDRTACKLSLYHLFRDAIVKEMDVPVYSAHVRASAVDNTLIVHAMQAKVPIVLDVYQGELQMVSTPLPIGVLLRGKRRNDFVMEVYGDGWEFLAPDLVLDRRAGLLWRLVLDLQGLAESTSEPAQLAAFLQRRDERRYPPPGPQALTLRLVETMLMERAEVSALSSVFRVLAAACSAAAQLVREKPDQQRKGMPGGPDSPCIPVWMMLERVFGPLESKGHLEGRYLLSVLTEYMWAMEAHAPGQCDPTLYAKIISLSLRMGSHEKLYQLFRPEAMPPAHVLSPLADLLLSMSMEEDWDPYSASVLEDLMVDVSSRGGDREQCVRLLLRQGRLLASLRFLRRWRVDSLPPQVFLDAAWSTQDPSTYIAVYRFCCDSMPGGASVLGTLARDRLHQAIQMGYDA